MIRIILAIPDLRFIPLAVFISFLAIILLLSQVKHLTGRKTTGILALCLMMFASLSAYYYNFIVDDVYISLRYARNLANGHGLVFNTDNSAPVEGYTNFLWVLLEAIFFSMNIDEETIVHIVKIIGVIFGAGVIVLTFRLIRLLTSDNRSSLMGAAFLSAVPEFSFWAVGGLETPMYMFWMLLGLYFYLQEKRNNKVHFWSMIAFFFMALTRPEGLFFSLAFVFMDLVYTTISSRKEPLTYRVQMRAILTGIATFVLLYAGYFIWRYSFYDLILPNTFYAKKMRSVGYLVHRIKQVSQFFVPLFPFLAIACLGYFCLHKNVAKEKLLLAGATLLLFSFSFAARNEWMPGYRYELPFVAPMIVFFSAGLSRILSNTQKEWGWHWPSRFSSFALLFFLGMFLLYEVHDLRKIGDNFASQLNRAHVPLGKWLKKYAPENASYASWDMGAVPFYSGIPHIIDINSEGLLNTYTTFHGYDIDRFLATEPSFLVLPPNTDYVRPAEIKEFYSHEKLKSDYEYLFTFAFNKDYHLNVFRHKKVKLSEEAIREGKIIADVSMLGLNAKLSIPQ